MGCPLGLGFCRLVDLRFPLPSYKPERTPSQGPTLAPAGFRPIRRPAGANFPTLGKIFRRFSNDWKKFSGSRKGRRGRKGRGRREGGKPQEREENRFAERNAPGERKGGLTQSR